VKCKELAIILGEEAGGYFPISIFRFLVLIVYLSLHNIRTIKMML